MKGKERCKILKEIRARIAEENDIEYITSECKHKGDCLGTCPKCESELRYLERQLEERRKKGLSVTVAGLAVALTVANTTACEPFTTQGDMLMPESSSETDAPLMGVPLPPESSEEELMGVPLSPESSEEELMGEQMPESSVDIPGEIAPPESSEEEIEIMGDMPLPEE